MKKWGKQRVERNFIHKEKIIFSKFDQNKQFEKGDVFKPIMGTIQRFQTYYAEANYMFFATEVLDKVKSNFFLFSGKIIFPLQNCKEKLGGG